MVMKKKISVLLSLCIIFVSIVSTSASAHEMYYTKDGAFIKTAPLRWMNKNTSTGRLKVLIDKDGLKGSWATYFEDARKAWHSSAAPAEFITSTSPNTYMVTTTAEYWKNRFPDDSSWNEYLGVADLYNSNNTLINSYSKASTFNNQIKSANIFLKPNPTNNTVHIYRAIMVHELGHVLCLGHSHLADYAPATTSIMNYNFVQAGTSYLPQTHEVNDVKAMYGY